MQWDLTAGANHQFHTRRPSWRIVITGRTGNRPHGKATLCPSDYPEPITLLRVPQTNLSHATLLCVLAVTVPAASRPVGCFCVLIVRRLSLHFPSFLLLTNLFLVSPNGLFRNFSFLKDAIFRCKWWPQRNQIMTPFFSMPGRFYHEPVLLCVSGTLPTQTRIQPQAPSEVGDITQEALSVDEKSLTWAPRCLCLKRRDVVPVHGAFFREGGLCRPPSSPPLLSSFHVLFYCKRPRP